MPRSNKYNYFNLLIDQVATFDKEAADHLRRMKYINKKYKTKPNNTRFLGSAFRWSLTPQGHDYWFRILNQLISAGFYQR